MAEEEEDAQLRNRPTRLQVIENKTRKVVVWFPVVLVLGILVYAYYVFVIEYCCKRKRLDPCCCCLLV